MLPSEEIVIKTGTFAECQNCHLFVQCPTINNNNQSIKPISPPTTSTNAKGWINRDHITGKDTMPPPRPKPLTQSKTPEDVFYATQRLRANTQRRTTNDMTIKNKEGF